jgi:hypothetical protein
MTGEAQVSPDNFGNYTAAQCFAFNNTQTQVGKAAH